MRNKYKTKTRWTTIAPPGIVGRIATIGCMFFLCAFVPTDMQAQVASCQDITRTVTAAGLTTITASELDDGTSTGGALYISSVGTTTFDIMCSDHPSITLDLVVSDGTNSSSCQSVVTITDGDFPTATCASSITADVGDVLTLADVDGGSSDACTAISLDIDGSPTYTVTCTDASTGTISVTLNVTDAEGNAASDVCFISVTDASVPVPSCSPFTLNLSSGGILTPADVGSFTDNCTDNVTEGVFPSSFVCDDIGANTVSYTVSDLYNSSSCTATVTVVDDVPPSISCIVGALTIALDRYYCF